MYIFTTNKILINTEEVMAMFKGMAAGVLSGMIGNVVVVNNKNGSVYLRKAPRKRKFSEKQKANWKRFSAVSAFWKQFNNSRVQQIWKVAEDGRRGINLFINANATAFDTEGEITDPDRLHFSGGKLPLPHKLMTARSAGDPQQIEVTWQNDAGTGLARADDELMIMIAHEGDFTGPLPTGEIRRKESALVRLPEVTGTIQGIYLFFASEKRKLYSGDQYFGI